MQELRPVPALAQRLFGGGAASPEAGEVRCPRCDSANTKFCYYNNYNLAQPRHFCRACRRYWTKGGLLRNVPVGGGCRKPKPKPKPKPKRPAAAADGAGKNDVHGAHRDAKNARSGCAGSSTAAADAYAAASDASSVGTTQQTCRRSNSSRVTETRASTGFITGGDTAYTLPPPLPLPEPMFADQAAAFASFFAPPPQAFNFSAQLPVAEQRGGSVLSKEPSPPYTVAAPDATPFAVHSSGGLRAGASEWPQSAVDGGIFELTGSIAGDTLLSSYWNPGSWTDPDTTIYQP